jgi:hypothetical protein
MLREIVVWLLFVFMTCSIFIGNIPVKSQNMTNASNFTGVENISTSGSVTARLNSSTPEPQPEDYPTPSAIDE